MAHELPNLEYDYNALEPYIDEETMKIHHDKHHQAYLDKFLAAIEKIPGLKEKPIEEILKNLNSLPAKSRDTIINTGGGYFHHSFFWKILKKDISFNKDSEIGKEIIKVFGSFEKFQEYFETAQTTLFGSGWAWLVVNEKGELEIIQTQNQNSPLSLGKTPILGNDVWEHAYYLKYKNKRPDYVKAFWNVINWEQVNQNFLNAKK